MKPVSRAKFRTAWMEGISGFVMAETFCIHRTTVTRYAKALGLPLRRRGQRSSVERRRGKGNEQ